MGVFEGGGGVDACVRWVEGSVNPNLISIDGNKNTLARQTCVSAKHTRRALFVVIFYILTTKKTKATVESEAREVVVARFLNWGDWEIQKRGEGEK